MYPPLHHQSKDIAKMIAVIQQFPLGLLLSAKGNIPFASHIPIIYNKSSKKLVAHLDKNNPQMETLKEGSNVTAVFNGPNTYISPSVYASKQLPTWNYIIVHVKGTISLINDPVATKKSLVDMTHFLEGKEQAFTLSMDDPRMDRLIHYIQAFEITPTHWEGKFKLSQDKSPKDFELAKNELINNARKQDQKLIEKIYLNLLDTDQVP